jgi:Glycosyltransferase sugar-binding region containing DXD motif
LTQPKQSPPKRHSAIPHILIFTHSVNLWNYSINNDNNTMTEESDELMALAANVHSIAERHPMARVRFLTNDDCVASIRSFVRLVHHETRSSFATATTVDLDEDELIDFFHREPRGMYKADLCRGTALYETGGLYLDVDVGVRLTPLWDVLQPTTEFATVRVHRQSHYPGAFFQAFMAATPRHAVIQRYVELFVQYYRGTLQLKPGPLGVLLLKQAYDEIQAIQHQEMLETPPTTTTSSTDLRRTSRSMLGATISTSRPPRTTSTHLNATSEIWQEILYAPQLQSSMLSHVPPPVWGRRRACKFVVATAPRLPLVVPLYSRIAGSRMCPRQNNATSGGYQGAVAEEPQLNRKSIASDINGSHKS